jgi:hypothetical protein
MRINHFIWSAFLLSSMLSCKKEIVPKRLFEFPNYIDTESKPIQYQEKKIYETSQNVFASNLFNGARLNNFYSKNDSTFVVVVSPENKPINASAWYSFKIWSNEPKKIHVQFQYDYADHRYNPKLSKDGKLWEAINPLQMSKIDGATNMTIGINKDTLWVSAQELFSTEHLDLWLRNVSIHNKEIKKDNYGKTPKGRTLHSASLYSKSANNKEIIILMSRQHPPEVTGQLAFLSFVERLLETDELTAAFKQKYQVLIFPMQNPDGVDLGHWRHNTGGVDLNRDWDRYNQPETKQMAEYIESYAMQTKSKVVLGLDFHSTWEDVYYTNLSDSATKYPDFTTTWLNEIKESLPNYEPKIAPSKIGQPVSKGWFFVNFNAVGVTYEIGDETPRDFIEIKSRIAAEKMMKVLLRSKK